MFPSKLFSLLGCASGFQKAHQRARVTDKSNRQQYRTEYRLMRDFHHNISTSTWRKQISFQVSVFSNNGHLSEPVQILSVCDLRHNIKTYKIITVTHSITVERAALLLRIISQCGDLLSLLRFFETSSATPGNACLVSSIRPQLLNCTLHRTIIQQSSYYSTIYSMRYCRLHHHDGKRFLLLWNMKVCNHVQDSQSLVLTLRWFYHARFFIFCSSTFHFQTIFLDMPMSPK